MAARFPQSATSVAWRIKPAYASKILSLYWAASANSVHRLRSGDTASTVLTRATSGATFDATNGRITGTSTVPFTDSVAGGIGGLRENSDFTLGAVYYGDLFNSVAETYAISSVPGPDGGVAGAKLEFYSNFPYFNVQGGAFTSATGFSNDVDKAIILAMRTLQSDGTAKQRGWVGGTENTSFRANTTPTSTALIGDTSRPIYFGNTVASSGNSYAAFEAVFIGTGALTDAEMAAITADPSILVEATPVIVAVDLTGAAMSGGSTIATGAVGYTAPPAGTNLIAAAMSGGSTIATGAVTYAPPTIKLISDAFTAWGDPTPMASLTVPHSSVSALDGTFLFHVAGAVTDSLGRLTFLNNGMVAGTDYVMSNWDATGANRGCKIYRAA